MNLETITEMFNSANEEDNILAAGICQSLSYKDLHKVCEGIIADDKGERHAFAGPYAKWMKQTNIKKGNIFRKKGSIIYEGWELSVEQEMKGHIRILIEFWPTIGLFGKHRILYYSRSYEKNKFQIIDSSGSIGKH